MPYRVTLQGRNVTLQGRNVTLQGRNVTLQGRNVTLQGRDVTPQGINVTPQGRNVTMQTGNVTLQGGKVTSQGISVTSKRVIVTSERCGARPIFINTMRFKSNIPPQTPAQRQAKCRAIKRGEWHTIPCTPAASSPVLGQSIAALPPPVAPAQKPRELPAPPAPPAAPAETAMQKATIGTSGVSAAALALPDIVTSSDASRLSLPEAVAARLRSLLDRHETGKPLTAAERAEAQGLLDIAEYFVVQRLRHRFAA